MNKTEYLDIKGQISFEKPLWITLALIAADWVLLYVALYFLMQGTWLSFLLSQALLTIFYFHNFGILHEAGHGNVSDKRWANTIIGHYASIFCFLPYFPWKYIHQEHHVWAGNIDKDPTMANLKKMRERGDAGLLVRIAWRSWIPLAAFLQHVVFWIYPFTMWQSGKMTRKSFVLSFCSIGWLILVYYLLITQFPSIVNLSNLWLSFILYLVMTEMVNLPHHVGVPTFHTSAQRDKLHPWEQNVTTRSCYYPYHLAELLTLNFNFHTEHHFFPNLPWYRLRKLRSIIKPIYGKEYNELYGIGWNLQNRSRDPNEIVLPEVKHPLLQEG